MNIPNYTFLEYCALPQDEREQINILSVNCEPFTNEVDIFNVGSFDDLTFGQVKDIQYDLSKKELTYNLIFEITKMLTGKSFDEIYNISFLDIVNFKNYLLGEMTRVNKIENDLLSYSINEDEERAGIDNFEKLGSYLQLRTLANNDVTKIEQVRNLKYNICLLELYTRKLYTDFEREMYRIQDERIKRQSGR